MSKNIFINNLDTYVSQAIFKELRNDQPDENGEANPDAYNIFGTYISKDSSAPPEGIKKMLKRSKPNLAMTYISKCDLIVYDLHSGNPEDVQLALDAMNKPRPDDDASQEKTIILISSLLAWDSTPRNLEEVRSPEDIQEEEEAARKEAEAKALAEAKAKAAEEGVNSQGEVNSGDGDGEASSPAKVEQSEVLSGKDGEAAKEEGEGEGEAENAEEEVKEEEAQPAAEVKRAKRKRYIHHPFTEGDYQKRKASAEYAKIKEVEDRVLNFKKEGVKTYVISAGVLYGLGEAIFNHHFERAWKQDPEKLPIVGEGKNFVPTIHVKDLARMVKKLFEAPPETKYIFGIDNTKRPTQKKLIQAISDGIGTGLVESTDIPMEYTPVHPKQTPLNLHLDWKKFVMLNIKALPSKIFVPDVEGGAEEGEGEGEEGAGDEGGFQWHCKNGLAGNIQRVKEEFCKERGLKPFKIGMTGKPCSGKSFYAAQLAKHYGVPHIHKEQVLHDIQNWNNQKEAEYNHRQSEKVRLDELAEKRAAEKALQDEEEKKAEAARQEEEKARRRAEVGSGDEKSEAAESEKEEENIEREENAEGDNKTKEEGAEGAEEEAGESKDDRQKTYEKQLKQLDEDEASSDDEFHPLDLKEKINKFYAENKTEKKIPSMMMSEAFRWRLSQNDCQNRGYILDGYPVCYQTCKEVFYITPDPPAPKPKKFDEEGNEIAEEEEVDPEEAEDAAKKYAPKFQSHIYPDSMILLRGKDDFLRKRAAGLKPEENTKWDPENLERRIETFKACNDVSLFQKANNDPMLGHPKAKQHMLPLFRFFQENKTEVFEIGCDGNTFEMFESMRVYIERDGRSYNYLPTVRVLNVKREEELVKEEKNFKSEKANAEAGTKSKNEAEKSALEKLQDGRLESIRVHMEELESTSNLNMRQFLMKQIIPVLTEGMIDVYRVGPTDPVDYLADYIFSKSNNLRKQVKTKKAAAQ